MKYTIKNPLNSPYAIDGEHGRVHVPARGEVTDNFTDMQIHAIRATGYFVITDDVKRDPLDHDGDGRKGGVAPDDDREQTETDQPAPRPRGRPRKDA